MQKCKYTNTDLWEENNKYLSNVQEKIHSWMKIIWDLKTKFNKEIETFKRIQVKMRMEWKNSVFQLENSEQSLTSKMNQTENIIARYSRGSRKK